MKKEWPKFKTNEIWEFEKTLDKKEKALIEKYLDFRRAEGINSLSKLKDVKRYILQFLYFLNKDYKKLNSHLDCEKINFMNNSIENVPLNIFISFSCFQQ